MYAAAAITPLLIFSAFLLLLLVSLSVPIIKSIDLLKLSAIVNEGISFASVQVTGSVKFGVWGYCISAINVEYVLFSYTFVEQFIIDILLFPSVAGQDFDRAAECSDPHLGFTFDQNVQNALYALSLCLCGSWFLLIIYFFSFPSDKWRVSITSQTTSLVQSPPPWSFTQLVQSL